MQPTFFPWLGYFNLIKNSDIFCLYDDAQFSKFSWHYRTLALVNKNEVFISVPTTVKLGDKINEVKISNKDFFLKKLKHTILLNCKEKTNIVFLLNLLEKLQDNQVTNINQFNYLIIHQITEYLNYDKNFIIRSKLNLENNKVKDVKVFDTLNKLNATSYLCGESGFEYLNEATFNYYKIKPYVLKIRDKKFCNGILHYLFYYDLFTIRSIINDNFYYEHAYD